MINFDVAEDVPFQHAESLMTSDLKKLGRGEKTYRLLIAGVVWIILCAMGASPSVAGTPEPSPPDAAADLQRAFTDAARNAKNSETLESAYVLLGMADAAQQQKLPQIAVKAATAFSDLVKRATAAALRAGGTNTEDTLDQLVDLRFVARTANLPLPQAALDEAMRSLFPAVAVALQRNIDNAARWENKLAFTDDLAELEASATQVLLEDIARELSATFDLKITQLENLANKEADTTERERMIAGLDEKRAHRQELLADAKANDINSVAEQMQKSSDPTSNAGSRSMNESDIPEGGSDRPAA
jgi:hypothetical protein